MTNLYPLRSTDPNCLPNSEDNDLMRENTEIIIALAKEEKSPIFWAAWGSGITIRPYLVKSVRNIIAEVQLVNGSWLHYGNLTNDGHPRHPSRLSYSWEFYEFNAINYAEIFT